MTEEVKKRITEKDTHIGDRTFKLKKLDAMTGSYMFFKLVGVLAPIFKYIDTDDVKDKLKNKPGSKKIDEKDINLKSGEIFKILAEITKLPQEDFQYIQRSCLAVVTEVYPGGNQSPPVLDKDGVIGILDESAPLLLSLMVQSLVFNVSGFFAEGLSGSLLEALTDLFQQNSPM